MQRIRRGFATLTAVALTALGTVFVGSASAVVLQCGAVVTQSTTLDADVGPCNGTAIHVRGNNITLNLNGRRVFGTPAPGEGPGIYLEGVTGVRVTNGTVSHFDTGIYIEFGGANTVDSMRVIDNIGGLHGEGIFGEGIQIFESNNNVITRNQVIHNGTFAGIDVFDSSGTRITSNTVANNNVLQVDVPGHHPEQGDILFNIQQDIGIWVVLLFAPSVNSTIVSDNQVYGNGLDGIQLASFFANRRVENNQVLRNSVVSNGFGQVAPSRDGSGIRLGNFVDNNLVQTNSVVNNAADGIALVGARNNRVLTNRSFGNDKGPNTSIQNFDMFDLLPNCDANIWSGNQFGTRNQPCIN